MKIKEQKVEIYSNLYYAKTNINRNIKDGWFVHTCISYQNNDEYDGVLVVYKREGVDKWQD